MAALNADAPRITDRLCDACAAHFAAVRAHLDALGVPYRLEPGLVRGLDYYTRTAFEFYVARPRGPAAGARRRRPLRRPRRAARRSADAGDRVRDRARPARPRARRAGRPGSRRPADDAPTAVVVGADPEATAERLRDRDGPARGRHRGARGARRIGSSASSSRRPPATRPTSRSSSATSSRTGRSSCGTCRPGRRSSSASTISLARSPGRTPRTATGDRGGRYARDRRRGVGTPDGDLPDPADPSHARASIVGRRIDRLPRGAAVRFRAVDRLWDRARATR